MEKEKCECRCECDENCICEECKCCAKSKAGVLDQVQEKVVSRKLLVFIAATALMVWSTLDPDTWAMIAAMYIGGQSVIDIAKVWKA